MARYEDFIAARWGVALTGQYLGIDGDAAGLRRLAAMLLAAPPDSVDTSPPPWLNPAPYDGFLSQMLLQEGGGTMLVLLSHADGLVVQGSETERERLARALRTMAGDTERWHPRGDHDLWPPYTEVAYSPVPPPGRGYEALTVGALGMAAVSNAVSRLYNAFNRYHPPRHHAALPAVVDLSPGQLDRFLGDTPESTGLLLHLLPRLFEVAGFGLLPGGTERLFHLFHVKRWRTWPEGERAAVQDSLDALWVAALLTHPSFPPDQPPLDLLRALAWLSEDLMRYLHIWDALLTPPGSLARRHRTFAKQDAVALQPARWSHRGAQRQQVIAWLQAG